MGQELLREEVNILVVDDVAAMRSQIRDLLKSFGFRKIFLCNNGGEAQAQLENDTYHLVLADWVMAPTSGLELLKSVRENPKFKDLPFVLVTAERTKESVMQAIEAGVDDYLVKPLTMDQIQDKVYAVLLKKGII